MIILFTRLQSSEVRQCNEFRTCITFTWLALNSTNSLLNGKYRRFLSLDISTHAKVYHEFSILVISLTWRSRTCHFLHLALPYLCRVMATVTFLNRIINHDHFNTQVTSHWSYIICRKVINLWRSSTHFPHDSHARSFQTPQHFKPRFEDTYHTYFIFWKIRTYFNVFYFFIRKQK